MLGERLAQARKQRGISQVALAAAMGRNYTQSMISHVERGRKRLVAEGLAEAARVLGVSADYLLGLTDNPGQHPSSEARKGGEAESIVEIHEINGVVSPGNSFDPTPKSAAALPRQLFWSMGINPSDCFLVRFQGDSMLPSLPEDCRLLIDRRSQLPTNQKVFLLDSPEGFVVKRIHRHEVLNWVLRSDSGVLAMVPLDETNKIIGEVRWFDGTL